ncbi:transposase, IS605 OrfB family [Methanohalobium evestigatum Z-7303]|uniref:Transposase, IS605 OrfB family n=1 Tax=Methanohalobium evestigatum (strain ATCC BAA-1072 / DSM 3721 / NBRC 107634 / OCM 161 / Z-7303) TaxID=644295 RepID=D7E9N9_METEZ|nr:RNA-guided endonuclease TnpB family protein [Methanohalobium evestigatum]ADI74311.1 transposase, IS605 OrfB family [Methanohalobium evestigatum Z-7303]
MKFTTKNYLRMNKQQYWIVDTLSKLSKNLYNVGVYNVRQYYFYNNKFLPYTNNYHYCKNNDNYSLLYSDNAQQVLKIVDRTFKSYFRLLKERKKGNYNRPINTPGYLDKNGRFVLIYPAQRMSIKGRYFKLGMSREFKKQYNLNGDELTFKLPDHINPDELKEVRIVPKHDGKFYQIQYVYDKKPQDMNLDKNQYLSIDLGLDNFATFVETSTGTAEIIDGKHIKSINQFYNKEKAKLQGVKDKQSMEHKFTKRLSRLTNKRDNKVDEFLNRSVDYIVKTCIDKDIGNIVIGELKEIKQEQNIGKKNNQNFQSIPYFLFKSKLQSKCDLYGINYIEEDESYTSKTDALALEPIRKHEEYMGRRIKRGLFKSSTGQLINADVNGALNILRKVVGDSIQRITDRGLVSRPERIRVTFEPEKRPAFSRIKLSV